MIPRSMTAKFEKCPIHHVSRGVCPICFVDSAYKQGWQAAIEKAIKSVPKCGCENCQSFIRLLRSLNQEGL